MRVTENNFEAVLKKIKRYTDSYKMYRFEKTHVDGEIISERLYSSIRLEYEWGNEGKRRLAFKHHCSFIEVVKHKFRIDYENGTLNGVDHKIYQESKPLIRVGIGADAAIIIDDGDSVSFLPFNMGFIIRTDNKRTRFDGPLHMYTNTFIPSFKNSIFDINEEVEKREMEEEKYNEMYDSVPADWDEDDEGWDW